MKWGSGFADLCVQHQVKLINYPRGLKPLGGPKGITSVSAIDVDWLRRIVRPRIEYWQQEAKERKRRQNKGAASLWDDEEEEEGSNKGSKLIEDDLVKFVSWDEGSLSFSSLYYF